MQFKLMQASENGYDNPHVTTCCDAKASYSLTTKIIKNYRNIIEMFVL